MGDRPPSRRQTVGKRLARARRAAGYRSQAAFADAIGIHETSIARAETGDERVGPDVFTRIELGLNLPDEIITRYIETGSEDLLSQVSYNAASTVQRPEPADSEIDRKADRRNNRIRAFLISEGVEPTDEMVAIVAGEIARMEIMEQAIRRSRATRDRA